jgi:GxxExxY protein
MFGKPKGNLPLYCGLEAGGAPVMWERVVLDALPLIRGLAPAGSRVLEVGYGEGLLSCYLCKELGWQMVGLDIDVKFQERAVENARKLGLNGCIKFDFCAPEETRRHTGEYNAVFIKTVLYNSPDLAGYGQWLDWILAVLKPGGVLINFETARANAFTQWYRRARRRSYTDLCLYNRQVEALYDTRFKILYRRYYGGWSQFFAPIGPLYRLAYRIEEAIKPRNADNCFVVAMIGKKPGKWQKDGISQSRKDAEWVSIIDENELAREIVDAAYQIHKKLGPGLLETVYETVLSFELEKRGLSVNRQVPVGILYEGIKFEEGFRADLIVNDKVINDHKFVETIAPVHKKPLLTYLRLADKKVGSLINFDQRY